MFYVTYRMGLLLDTHNCGLRMRRECRERFPRHILQRKPLVSHPGMHHGTCVTHVPRCMSGSLTCSVGENLPGIPGACATCNLAYLVRGPWCIGHNELKKRKHRVHLLEIDFNVHVTLPTTPVDYQGLAIIIAGELEIRLSISPWNPHRYGVPFDYENVLEMWNHILHSQVFMD